MRMIYLFQVPDNSDDALEPLDTFPNTSMDNTLANAYPAHVFNPTGELGVPGSSLQPWKERITIAVGSSPDAPKDERFANNPKKPAQRPQCLRRRFSLKRIAARAACRSRPRSQQ